MIGCYDGWKGKGAGRRDRVLTREVGLYGDFWPVTVLKTPQTLNITACIETRQLQPAVLYVVIPLGQKGMITPLAGSVIVVYISV